MTSKYEDALKRIQESTNKYEIYSIDGVVFSKDDIALIDEALRKAESMDRLIEARKVATRGEWYEQGDYSKPARGTIRCGKECIGDMRTKSGDRNRPFICLAANETAKFIEDCQD